MLEIVGDFWKIWQDYNIICIPTNGCVKKNGRAVMGAGLAKQAIKKWPGIDQSLGRQIEEYGNRVATLICFSGNSITLIAFPTKRHWQNKADLELIERSAHQLRVMLKNYIPEVRVLLPQPGTGCGRLSWEKEVKPILAPILDDRITVIGRM